MEHWTNGRRVGRAASAALIPTILLLVAGCGTIPSGPPIEAVTTTDAQGWALEAAALIDSHRAVLGCTPLRWHHEAAGVAEAYARQMSDEEFFGHVDPSGTTLRQRLFRGGVNGYRLAAETIAAGQANPPKVVADWIASPPHRKIVEDCRFDRVGLGFHRGNGPYGQYWTAVFVETR